MLASLSSTAIALSKNFLPHEEAGGGLLSRLGSKTVVAATVRAIQLLGRQFVLGRHIGEAMAEAQSARRSQPTLRFSYDMLGEGARTERDAQRYLASYQNAIAAIAKGPRGDGPEHTDGISIKLSALFSRYEDAQRERVFAELVPRVWTLIDAAARADMNLTIDAEESDRLELSLDVFEPLAARIAEEHPRWRGFGLAIQAYQTRALEVVDEVARIARAHHLQFMVRLVKGAYWDGEIKRAQEQGLAGYPVFTHKQHTDIAYLACARALIGHADVIYPQFASHNAATVAAIAQMARAANAKFEFQRLHGMGEGVFREVLASNPKLPLRIYAPVGEHRDLLAYLVRRLLENGANSSFVHQLADDDVPPEQLLASPLSRIAKQALAAAARSVRGAARHAAQLDRRRSGLPARARAARRGDRRRARRRRARSQRRRRERRDGALVARLRAVERDAAGAARRHPAPRRRCARRAPGRVLRPARQGSAQDARRLRGRSARGGGLPALLRRTKPSSTSRKAAASSSASARGTFRWRSSAARSPPRSPRATAWLPNPPSKRRSSRCAASSCCTTAGVPRDALALLHGPGETVGAALVAHEHTAGVAFTGSTPVAQIINRTLANQATRCAR